MPAWARNWGAETSTLHSRGRSARPSNPQQAGAPRAPEPEPAQAAAQHLLCICAPAPRWHAACSEAAATLAGSEFWTMGWAPETPVNFSKCFSKEIPRGSLKRFCARGILRPENERQNEEKQVLSSSQGGGGHWRRCGKASIYLYCHLLAERKQQAKVHDEENSGSEVLPHLGTGQAWPWNSNSVHSSTNWREWLPGRKHTEHKHLLWSILKSH